MPTVLLCTDEPVLAAGLAAVLVDSGLFRLAGICSDLERLAEELERHKPDLLLLDLTAEPDAGRLESLKGIAGNAKIVLRVKEISGELAMRALSNDVRGVLRRTLPMETLLRCMTRVQEGELWFEKALTDALMSPSWQMPVTPREHRLTTLLSQGLKSKEIAGATGIGEGSIRACLSRLCENSG